VRTIIAIDTATILERLGVIQGAVQAELLVLERVCVDSHVGAIELVLAVRDACTAEHLPELRRGVAQHFQDTLQHVVLRPRYATPITLEQYLRIHWPDVCYDLHCASRGILNFLEPCRWEVRQTTVWLSVANDVIVRKLRELKCAEIVAASIRRDLGGECRIELQVGDFSAEISANLQRRQEQVAAEVRVQQQQAVAERQRIVFDSNRVTPREPTEIKRIHAEKPLNKSVTIRGCVVSYRPAEGDAFFERCTLTDYGSSIDCFLRVAGSRYSGNGNGNHAPKKPALQLQVGEWLLLSGVVDRPREDLEVRIERIERIERPLRKETAAAHRVELHAHTKMSQMDGLTALDELVARAAHWKHPAIGITDHGNVHAFPEAHALAKKHGVKVLLGSEAYLANHLSTEIEQVLARKEKSGRGMSRDEIGEFKNAVHHIIIYARTPQGLRNLYELISLAHCKYFYIKPMIPRDVLLQYREGLLIGSACECGELFRLVLHAHLTQITPAEFAQQFGAAQALYDYFEIQPRANNMFYVAKGTLASEEDLLAINRRICALGEQYGKPVVATGDLHVLDPHELLLRRVLQIGQGYDKESDESGDTPLYFKTTDEMLEEFAYLGPEVARMVVIENPQRIAASVEEIAPIPSGFHPPKLEGAEDDLRQMCERHCQALYGAQPHPLVTRRMQRELTDIVKNHFADLYMLAHKVVKKSLDDGYIVGSRGSVGSSFVAFLARITEVNSLPPHYACAQCSYTEFIQFDERGEPRAAALDGIQAEVGEDLPPRICPQCGAHMQRYGFDIPFETFVGFEGNKTPDIDLNFASEYQARAHRYIEDLFGKDHVYRAGTISTLQDRMAFGFVQKYLEKTGEQWPQAEVNRIIEGLVGIKRTTGQHPGGMIILPQHKRITEFCPVQYPANNADSANQTTHFDYHAMEEQLLKLDILGHDDPTQIRLLSEYTGMDITKVPLNDPKTLSLFSGVKALGVGEKAIGSRVGTYGIPEFGTDFVRGMLDDTRPQTFADIIRISGLSHGTDVWLNNARDIIKNGHATLQQCICTRDDIMHYLIEKGLAPFSAFKIMEQVRKGKGLKPDDVSAMRAQKVPDWYIESCQRIKYMFPKAHAVAYVINALRIAYCKVHQPVAFYATYFTVMRHALNAPVVAGGKRAIRAAMDELEATGRRKLAKNEQDILTVYELALEMCERGIRMRPVDIYKSDATHCVIENGEIIPPLIALAGLGAAAAENMIRGRAGEPFKSREEFQIRTHCNRAALDVLAQAGALEGLPDSDQMDMFDTTAAGARPAAAATPAAATATAPRAPAPVAAPAVNAAPAVGSDGSDGADRCERAAAAVAAPVVAPVVPSAALMPEAAPAARTAAVKPKRSTKRAAPPPPADSLF